MRRPRQFLSSEIYFTTIRTVEERFALEPFSCPNAWIQAEGVSVDVETRLAMRERGRVCIEAMAALVEDIAQSEQNPNHPRPKVSYSTFTNSIPNIVGSCLARGVELFGVEIFAFVWMSNHMHLLMRAPKGNFAAFMAYLNGHVAVNVNRFLGRKHALWSRRYAAAQVLDDAAALQLLGYILANPQNAGLVTSIDEWAGLSSSPFYFEEREQRFLRFDRAAWYRHGQPDDIAPFLVTVALEHKILPQLASLDAVNRAEKVRQLIHDQGKPSSSNNKDDLDARTIAFRRQLSNRTSIPTDRPLSSTANPRIRSPQPPCHTTNPALWRIYRAWYREFRSEYKNSSLEYRLGNVSVLFPPGSFAPANHPRARYLATEDARPTLVPTATNLAIAAMHMSMAA